MAQQAQFDILSIRDLFLTTNKTEFGVHINKILLQFLSF